MPIEQVYCTHCTYGTSALEQREGELADRVLGYSARAGSAERNELRNDYRAIERFLYYYLPSDTPPEEKQRLDAAGAPRRLFFCPSMGRLQMVGQVAYRQYDTAGRLGSYFAHVLFTDRAGGGWSTVDCLRLWNAPWTQEDSPEHPFKLSSLQRLDDVWGGAEPPVGDKGLLQFLQSSASADDSPGQVTGSRWQKMPVQQRIDLVANTLQGLLALGTQRRESVLLVVEPDIAAIVFYGVARLLPKPLAEGLSFSTYEPNAERLPVTLAATTFFDPQTTDVRTDLYRRRGLVINTYQDRISEGGVPQGNYARFMIEQLLEEGWPAVDRLREAFEAAGAKRPEELEALVSAHRLVSQVLSPSAPADDSWRKSGLAARYLAREVQHQLATPPGNGFRLNRVIGTPNHLTVLELIACEPAVPGLQRPAQLLLKEFPPERIAELAASPLLARGAKLEALASYTSAQGRLPDGCQLLAEPGSLPKVGPVAGDWLLPDLLARLPDGVLRRAYEALDEAQRAALLPALIAACKQPGTPAAPKRLLLDVLARLSDEAFFDALARFRRELGEAYPSPEPVLARRLGQALYALPDRTKDFETRLAVLEQWKSYFSYPELAERRLGDWRKVRSCLLELDERERKAAAGHVERLKRRFRPPRPPNFKPLGEALARAMPKRPSELDELAEVAENCRLDVPQFKARLEFASRRLGCEMTFERQAADDGTQAVKNGPASGPQAELEQLQRRREQQARLLRLLREFEERLWIYGDDASGQRKLQVLQRIAQTLLGRSPLTLAGKQQIELYFETGLWPTPGALSTGKGKRRFKLKHPQKSSKRRSWIGMAGLGLAVALLLSLLGFFLFEKRAPRVATPPTVKPTPTAKTATKRPRKPVKSPAPEDAEKQSAGRRPRSPLEHRPEEEPAEVPAATKKDPRTAVAPKDDSSAGGAGSSAAPNRATAKPPASDGPRAVPSTDKPADGKQPASAQPAMAKDEPGNPASQESTATAPDSEPATRTVDEYLVLPLRNDSSLKALDLPAENWPAQTGRIKLRLHGLDLANEWLKRQADGQLIVSFEGQGLRVAVRNGTHDQDLARFVVDEKAVRFQWLDAGGQPASFHIALQRCVLEVAGEQNATFLALTKPVTTGDRGMQAATLDLQALHEGEFSFDSHDEIALGRGQIELTDGSRIAFGAVGRVAQSADIDDLPPEYSEAGAQMRLSRRADNPLVYELRLVSSPDKLPDGLGPLSDGERKVLAELRERLPKLETAAGKLGPRATEKLLTAIDQHVKSLSEALAMPAPPKYDSTRTDAAKTYEAEIREKIIQPAAILREALLKRQKADIARQSEFRELKSHAFKFSTVLYRRVDRDVYACCLILADEQWKASTTATSDADNSDVGP